MRRREALLGVAALAGCASAPDLDPADTSLSLVTGYIDAKEAPSSVSWVLMRAYGAGRDDWYRFNVGADGYFLNFGVEPGAYQIDKFGGAWGLLGTGGPAEYLWATQGRNDSALHIRAPGAYFVGAFRYRPAEGRFRMERIAHPSEKEALERALAKLTTQQEYLRYTHQRALVQARLKELRS